MAEYIEREAVINQFESNGGYFTYGKTTVKAIVSRIKMQPAADVEPVRHGKWLSTRDENKKMCSCCEIIHFIVQYPFGKINYCPNCGAKMDGGKNDTT